MARLTTFLLGFLVFLRPACARQDEQDLQFKEAGVCSRCHVISVVEWGMSGHRKSGTNCVACHGESQAHVADERNNVKPDRVPHDAAIARMCMDCHKRERQTACQKCHQVHALVDPNKPAMVKDEPPGKPAPPVKSPAPRPNRPLAGFVLDGGDFDAATGLPRRVRIAGLAIPMVLVGAGEFDMGSERFESAKPVHTVRVKAFYLARHELTQDEWKSLMGSNPSAHQGKEFPDAGGMPVEQVSWQDCQALVQKLNERVPGGGFRLPTEAEWEHAARAGDGSPDVSEASAPSPVEKGQPDRLGLYGMRANVWEWCSTLLRPYPYIPSDGREDPAAPGLRVLRGGSYLDLPEWFDPGARHGERPSRRLRWNGVRLARSVPQ